MIKEKQEILKVDLQLADIITDILIQNHIAVYKEWLNQSLSIILKTENLLKEKLKSIHAFDNLNKKLLMEVLGAHLAFIGINFIINESIKVLLSCIFQKKVINFQPPIFESNIEENKLVPISKSFENEKPAFSWKKLEKIFLRLLSQKSPLKILEIVLLVIIFLMFTKGLMKKLKPTKKAKRYIKRCKSFLFWLWWYFLMKFITFLEFLSFLKYYFNRFFLYFMLKFFLIISFFLRLKKAGEYMNFLYSFYNYSNSFMFKNKMFFNLFEEIIRFKNLSLYISLFLEESEGMSRSFPLIIFSEQGKMEWIAFLKHFYFKLLYLNLKDEQIQNILKFFDIYGKYILLFSYLITKFFDFLYLRNIVLFIFYLAIKSPKLVLLIQKISLMFLLKYFIGFIGQVYLKITKSNYLIWQFIF